MKNIFFILSGLCFILSVLTAEGQNFKHNSSVTGVCYAGKNVRKIYIPPPEEYFKKSGTKSGGSITVYYTGFSSQAILAFEKAVSILKTMLPSDTKMTIKAIWEKNSNDKVLGNSVITGYAAGWSIDALNPLAFYPVSLAEKIAGQSLNNDADGDLELRINSSISWYLGTDGQTPTNKYDLVTVVLHEVCHGLGFFDSMNTDENIGYYGVSSIPMAYESFVENAASQKITDTLIFKNYSSNLKSQLTGNQLYFNGPLLKQYSGTRAKLYAPSTWDQGSSVSHLDEDTYKDPKDSRALMTPQIDYGEAIHDPGKFIFSMLGDLGWINTRIIHHPAGDTEKNLSVVELAAEIKSDTLFNKDKVGVVYSFNNFHTRDTIYLTSTNNIYKTTVSIPSYNSDLQYYFFTEDCFKRLYKSPSLDEFKYKSYIGTDTVKPVMQHTPISYCLQTVDSLSFRALAADNIGIDSVYVEYKINDGAINHIGLKHGTFDQYNSVIEAKHLGLHGGDSIKYRIVAIDSAMVANTTVLPKNGFYSFPVERITSVINNYSTDFSLAAPDFFNIGFNISKPVGFSKYGLHTKHPYESPEDNAENIEYTAMLRHPVKIDDSGLIINFKEIVLVEPGEPGSVFGSNDFYDYVIVEGSVDFGKTWTGLAAGYDSRIDASWESDYNNYISGMNSTYLGTESMFMKHAIYFRPTDKIAAGDTMLLRFRLYSDPYANGWGWAIEDLKLNPLIDAVEKTTSETLNVYPNPGNGVINLNKQENYNYSAPFRYSVYNSSGFCFIRQQLSDGSGIIDLSSYPSGIYIIVIQQNNEIVTFKYSLIK